MCIPHSKHKLHLTSSRQDKTDLDYEVQPQPCRIHTTELTVMYLLSFSQKQVKNHEILALVNGSRDNFV